MKVIAVMPVHGRLPLLKHTIERLYKRNGIFKVICVGDLPEDRKLCESVGAEWVQHRNRPLGAKWNAGFYHAGKYSPDACLFVGSSDWVSDNWIHVMGPYLDQYDMIGTAGCYFLHVGSSENRLCFWPGYIGRREGESIGIGRMISRRVLDKMHWRPFNPNLDRSLDYSMQENCRKLAGNIHLIDSENIQSVSISTDAWMNKHKFDEHYNQKYPSQIIENAEEWIARHFPEANLIFNFKKT